MIRPAAQDEAEKLSALALRSKAHWGYPQNWLNIWKDDLTISAANISETEIFVLETKDEICGFYVLVVDNTTADLEHLWVDPRFIGKGSGKELFQHAVKRAKQLGVSQILITADPNAESFYTKMGDENIGSIISDNTGVRRMLPQLSYNL